MPPKPPGKSYWHPPLALEDAALWEDVKKTVKRLAKKSSEKPQLVKAGRPDSQSPKLVAKLPAPVAAAPASSFDRMTMRKIKSGKIEIDARLDLHGLRQEAAHCRLEDFIFSARQRGAKLVLVITGKGDRFSKDEGVLRRQVPRWLKETQLSRAILSFSKAAAAHGGDGAFYVRLRRR